MFDQRVEKRLSEWALWWLDVETGNEGYPKKSSITLFQDGFVQREEFKSIPLISNEQAQQMDVWLSKMDLLHPEYCQSVVLQYLSDRKPVEIARILGISKRTFYERVHGGKTWLSGCITHSET